MKRKLPKVLYKYRDWSKENHRRIIEENEIYFTSPKDFNDPFDCRIAPNITQLNDEEIKKFIDKTIIQNFSDFDRKGFDIEKLIAQRTIDLTSNKIEEQRRFEEETFKKQDLHFGIFSLSKRWDSILMWSHYANNHSGICIGFYAEELEKIASLNPVAYSNKFPIISALEFETLESMIPSIYTKAKDWNYEKEYRLFDISHPDTFIEEKRKVIIPDKCFSDVTLGLTFDETKIDGLKKNLKKKKIPFYKIEKVSLKFKLKRVRLE